MLFGWINDRIDKTRGRLNSAQAIALNSMSIDGLVFMQTPGNIPCDVVPDAMEAHYEGKYIGTAYGKLFEPVKQLTPQAEQVIGVIRDTYLHLSEE